jgi:hypothetical protein
LDFLRSRQLRFETNSAVQEDLPKSLARSEVLRSVLLPSFSLDP